MRWYELAWLIWAVSGLLLEGIVLVFGVKGATLSEQIWRLRDSGSGWFSLLMFFLAWMIYHFIRENVGAPDLPETPIPTPVDPGTPQSPSP